MPQKNQDKGTEWIFCRDIKGECSGLSKNTQVIEKVSKTIKIHGETVQGWNVKIVSEKSDVHINLNSSKYSDE